MVIKDGKAGMRRFESQFSGHEISAVVEFMYRLLR